MVSFIIKLFAYIYIHICKYGSMLNIAGQTAEPNWLKLFEEIHEYAGGLKTFGIIFSFQKLIFFKRF